ncbi:MAG: nitroreductase family protein [Bacteroidales bacterium]|nr:nitroreductase family protein [Candidatus Physcousia equi]
MTLLETMTTRRSIRKYAARDVEPELLNKLLEAAARTQTMGNLQLYSVVVTRDASEKQRLAPAHFNQPMVTAAPVVLTICADFNRTTVWCNERKATPGYDNMLSFINAASDALLFTQTFSCLAEQEGLGVCYLGTTVYMPRLIIETLGLPRLVMPIATLTVGWPDEQPEQTDRLPVEAFVHEGRYRNYRAEDINTLYKEKEERPENRQFVALNGKETLAQVFTDCRYTKSDNEALSKGFIDVLCEQGFLTAEQANQANYGNRKLVTERPEVLECDVVRFQNKKEKWVAFVGLLDGEPYEIFTGLQDEEEGILLPKSVQKGKIIKASNPDGTHRYDFQFENKRGYKMTVEGLSGKFNKEYWNYAKLISGVIRYHMPLESVIHLVTSLSLDDESINTWKNGVARALKKYTKSNNETEETAVDDEDA